MSAPRPTTSMLSLWRRLPHAAAPDQPSVVLRPHMADPHTGVICLAELEFAYLATAVSFSPGDGWSSATLCETTDPDGRGLELTQEGVLDLFTVGWAGRAGAIRFSR